MSLLRCRLWGGARDTGVGTGGTWRRHFQCHLQSLMKDQRTCRCLVCVEVRVDVRRKWQPERLVPIYRFVYFHSWGGENHGDRVATLLLINIREPRVIGVTSAHQLVYFRSYTLNLSVPFATSYDRSGLLYSTRRKLPSPSSAPTSFPSSPTGPMITPLRPSESRFQ